MLCFRHFYYVLYIGIMFCTSLQQTRVVLNVLASHIIMDRNFYNVFFYYDVEPCTKESQLQHILVSRKTKYSADLTGFCWLSQKSVQS